MMQRLAARVRSKRAVVTAVLMATACGTDLSVGEPPDVSSIVEDYRAPTGSLAMVDLPTFQSGVESTFELVGKTSEMGFARSVVESLAPVSEDLDIGFDGPPEATQVARLDREQLVARIEARFICEGWDADTEPSERDGRVDLVAAADRDGIYPLMWGEAVECRRRLADRRIQLDGDLALYVDANRSRIRARDITRNPVIVAYAGDLAIDGGAEVIPDVEIDLRLGRESQVVIEGTSIELSSEIVEVRLDIESEIYILAFAETSLDPELPRVLTMAVRAADGLWGCSITTDVGQGTCRNIESDEEVQWP